MQTMTEAEIGEFHTEVIVPTLTRVIHDHMLDVTRLTPHYTVFGLSLQNVKDGLFVGATVYDRISVHLMRRGNDNPYLTAERLAAIGIVAGIFLGKQEGIRRVGEHTLAVLNAHNLEEAEYPGMFAVPVYVDAMAESWCQSMSEDYPGQTDNAIIMAREDLAEWATGIVGDFTAFIRTTEMPDDSHWEEMEEN